MTDDIPFTRMVRDMYIAHLNDGFLVSFFSFIFRHTRAPTRNAKPSHAKTVMVSFKNTAPYTQGIIRENVASIEVSDIGPIESAI